jgi:hypothetical protein
VPDSKTWQIGLCHDLPRLAGLVLHGGQLPTSIERAVAMADMRLRLPEIARACEYTGGSRLAVPHQRAHMLLRGARRMRSPAKTGCTPCRCRERTHALQGVKLSIRELRRRSGPSVVFTPRRGSRRTRRKARLCRSQTRNYLLFEEMSCAVSEVDFCILLIVPNILCIASILCWS